MGVVRRKAATTADPQVDYEDLTVVQLRALLKERGLVRRGRKKELIRRLQCDDAGELDMSFNQPVGGMASTASDGRAVNLIRPGDTVFLRAHTGRNLEVEHEQVMARWDDAGDWQEFTIEKSPLVIDDTDTTIFQSGDQNHGMRWQGLVLVKHANGALVSGDTVFLQSNAGTYIDVEGDETRARWEDEGDWQALVLEKKDAGADAKY